MSLTKSNKENPSAPNGNSTEKAMSRPFVLWGRGGPGLSKIRVRPKILIPSSLFMVISVSNLRSQRSQRNKKTIQNAFLFFCCYGDCFFVVVYPWQVKATIRINDIYPFLPISKIMVLP